MEQNLSPRAIWISLKLRKLFSYIRTPIIRYVYQQLAIQGSDKELEFLNYGYAYSDKSSLLAQLEEEDKKYLYPIQLYHSTATKIDLAQKSVLEVGSGQGGGAHYVSRYLKPKRIVGMDLSQAAVQLANQKFGSDNLSYVEGDALHLPFNDGEFDVVLNVESSHCYGDVDQFLSEVSRVLKPGGHMLFTDFRYLKQVPALALQLERSGLELISTDDITPNVIEALELDSPRRIEMIEAEFSKEGQRKRYKDFAGVVGTPIFRSFAQGRRTYFTKVLRKPA